MWKRFAASLRCPECHGPLDLTCLEEADVACTPENHKQAERQGISEKALCAAVDSGLLTCPACRAWHPILSGLPVLLPYASGAHEEFRGRHGALVQKLGSGYRTPSGRPVRGEEFVLRSFSTEWLDYSYDGVVWTWTYEDREALFLAEMGPEAAVRSPARFLEIGCGLGLVTSFAARHLPGEAVGVDLSLAVLRAVRQFRTHPFLHFVQASLWNLPFERAGFDVVYSHGVIHHTHSTEKALQAVADFCAPEGRLYVWVYGPGSIHESWARRIAYGLECVVRPVLARLPSPLSNAALAPCACAYIGFNRIQRLAGSRRQPYNYQRALHAARDRFTPLYAHRTSPEALQRWFRELGFDHLHVLGEEETPPAVRETIRRNVGLRGTRSTPAASSPAPEEKE